MMTVNKPIRVVAIDDDEGYFRRYREQLGPLGVQVEGIAPTTEPSTGAIVRRHPDAVLVDYQLSDGKSDASYKGPTLAAALREKLPATPILLVSRKSLLQRGALAPAGDLSGAFDELVLKEYIFEDPRRFSDDLRVLVNGFQALRASRRKTVTALLRILAARRGEAELLLAADPPAEVLERRPWRVASVSRWIRKTLLAHPGLLYDSLHAAVALGVSENSFLGTGVQRYFAKARYAGVFAPPDGRWWKRRLLVSAHEFLGRGHLLDEGLSGFREAWRKIRHERLSPSVCVSSGEIPADAVCCILRKPVMRRYSLPYRPDSRPAVMDEARISFKAIKETNEWDEFLVPPEAHTLLKQLETANTDDNR